MSETVSNTSNGIDPTIWKIHDGRLYLNLDQNMTTLFNKDVAGHIAQADENWKTLGHQWDLT